MNSVIVLTVNVLIANVEKRKLEIFKSKIAHQVAHV